ncbi:hypothetical protein [Sphingobium sp.]|nr:hypothetical protein [Sphingobium sp.]
MKIPLKPILKWVGTTLITAALQDLLGRIASAPAPVARPERDPVQPSEAP